MENTAVQVRPLVRAKFCASRVETFNADTNYPRQEVHLHAVYGPDNAEWASATPGGGLFLLIDNPAAHGVFVQGKEYFLDFTPAA